MFPRCIARAANPAIRFNFIHAELASRISEESTHALIAAYFLGLPISSLALASTL